MKTIKPQKLGVLTRVFEHGDDCHFTVSLLVFFPFSSPASLLPEVALWKFAAQELGRDGALDVGMPKSRGELLVKGKAYPPGGAPSITCKVRVKLGAVDKTLQVIGNRQWKRGGWVSDPEPFTELPITYENAFGGEGYAPNPLGKGFAPVRGAAGELHPLPNVEDPRHLVRSPKDRPPPAGFGPYDLTWPQRFSKVGTYDEKWLKERFPGFAADIDWTLFNAAPDDQQIADYFRGDETLLVENLHPTRPVLEAALPGVATRAFITHKTAGGEVFKEIPTRLDTVWLFPHAERGVLLFRGVTKVADDEGADVLHLVAACEELGAPKPVEHYRQVLEQRLDKEKGYARGLRDSDLMPPQKEPAAPLPPDAHSDVAGLVEKEDLLRKNLRRKAELEREAARARVIAMGLDPEKLGPPPLPPEEELPDLENLEVFVDKLNATAAQQQAEAERIKAEAEAENRRTCEQHGLHYDQIFQEGQRGTLGPPKFSAEEEMGKLRRLQQAFKAAGNESPELDAMVADPALWLRLKTAEQKLLETYKASVHHRPPATRLGDESVPLQAAVQASRHAGQSLAGWDLTGADLSGLVLQGADLRDALMESVDLTGTDLTGADLTGAVLAHADLSRASLSGAKLAGANLGSAGLRDARLDGADLAGAVLVKADLSRADLHGARLEGADLSEAVLAGADLREVSAPELTFLKSDLSRVKCTGADFTKSNFLEVTVAGADFTGAALEGAVFISAQGGKAVFRDARLGNLRMVKECAFDGADFQGAGLEGANLRGSRLSGSNFSHARLRGADLSECNLREAKLYRAEAQELRLARADLTGAVLVSANLIQAILQKADLTGADFTGANLFRADLAKVRGKAKSVTDANLAQVRVVARRADG